MSEAELYLIGQRMLSGKLAKAERGESRSRCRWDTSAALRARSSSIPTSRRTCHLPGFHTFSRLGTLNPVLRYSWSTRSSCRSGRIRASQGGAGVAGPARETLEIMLHNPVYAGYYAYGPRQVEPCCKVPGLPSTGRVAKDADEWPVLLPGRLPAYITEEEYEANAARMAANRQTAAAPGAPRNGAALLSGLLRCGRCGGHRMTVSYHDASARSAYGYACAFYQVNYGTGGSCQHSPAPRSTTTLPAKSWMR